MDTLGYLDLVDLAKSAIQRGELEVARERFEQALGVKPDAVEVHYGLGTLFFVMKDAEAAKARFLEVLELDPRHAGAAVNLGALANMAGQFDEAVKHLRRGIAIDPKRSDAYYNLGIAYRKLGRNELAIQAYREAHHNNPRMVEALYNLANVYFDMDRFEQAAAHYKKALEVNPGFVKAREALVLAERKARPATETVSDNLLETGYTRAIIDPFAGDARLDRLLDPEHDFDALARIHGDASHLRRDCELWEKATDKLDEALRDLSIAIGSRGGGPDLHDTLERFQTSVGRFREVLVKVEEGRAVVCKQRDLMVERG